MPPAAFKYKAERRGSPGIHTTTLMNTFFFAAILLVALSHASASFDLFDPAVRQEVVPTNVVVAQQAEVSSNPLIIQNVQVTSNPLTIQNVQVTSNPLTVQNAEITSNPLTVQNAEVTLNPLSVQSAPEVVKYPKTKSSVVLPTPSTTPTPSPIPTPSSTKSAAPSPSATSTSSAAPSTSATPSASPLPPCTINSAQSCHDECTNGDVMTKGFVCGGKQVCCQRPKCEAKKDQECMASCRKLTDVSGFFCQDGLSCCKDETKQAVKASPEPKETPELEKEDEDNDPCEEFGGQCMADKCGDKMEEDAFYTCDGENKCCFASDQDAQASCEGELVQCTTKAACSGTVLNDLGGCDGGKVCCEIDECELDGNGMCKKDCGELTDSEETCSNGQKCCYKD